MTTITKSVLDASYAEVRENPLPCFRAKSHDMSVSTRDDVPFEYTHLLGLDCGKRVLPYTVQDRYSRKLQSQRLPSIVLENDYLKATFLPTLGGRLISLFDKQKNTELVYANKAIQFANLAARDAWFAGGIEWNVGQYGHTYFTASDVCFTEHEHNNEVFLRMTVYERAKKVFFQIDFHLPAESHMLYAYMKVRNLYPEETSLYYWTNTAVKETRETRVFASSDHAFFLNPKPTLGNKEYGYMTVPDVPLFPGVDASYPSDFSKCSFEYFFTCNHDDMPWETAIQKDGIGFFEASTKPLDYRKMFCWGTGHGGKHWQEFLAPGQDTHYLEVQSGLAPSQLHGLILNASSDMDWLQAFGSLSVNSKTAQDPDYHIAKNAIQKATENLISSHDLNQKLQEYRNLAESTGKLLHDAENWASTEAALYDIPLPAPFAIASVKNPWHTFLKTEHLPTEAPFSLPFVCGLKWIEKLSKTPHRETEKQKATRLYYLAIAKAEEEHLAEAEELFRSVAEIYPNAIVYRNIAKLKEKMKDPDAAIRFYRKAKEKGLSIYMQEEYFQLLINTQHYKEAISFYAELTEISEILLTDRARLAILQKDTTWFENGFFCKEFTSIREGKTILSDLWTEYYRLKGIEAPPIPSNLDFRQIEY